MSLWSTIPLGVGIIAVLIAVLIAVVIAVIKRRTSGVTTLHIDH